jgi:hypothetical protein
MFGGSRQIRDNAQRDVIDRAYPNAHVIGCSTSGEICDTEVTDGSLVVTAVELEHSGCRVVRCQVDRAESSCAAGRELAQKLERDGLVHVFVLSDGLGINGSDLARGLAESLPPGVTVTGGLSGDGDRFEKTWVIWNGAARSGVVTAVGLYGERLRVGYGSLGGWDPFGSERLITRAEGNVLYELDGRSALQLYKQYLGEHAAELPASGLLFPLAIRDRGSDVRVVRTILGVDEEQQSMTFAGDMPEGAYARLMKANFDRLIDGAVGAARESVAPLGGVGTELAILISCVGRKMVLKQRVEEEVEGVREVVGDGATLAGFYSYGEISPVVPSARCELHNQTMTITTLSEA